MIGYKMFPAILEKIWAGIDEGKIKMDIWESFTAQERHEVNKLTEGDKGEQEKERTWQSVKRQYRRALIGYPEVKNAYIRVMRCPSCNYDHADVTIAIDAPYSVDMSEKLAKIDLDINLSIRPYYFDWIYIDEEVDMTGFVKFYHQSQRRLKIADTLKQADELLLAGKLIHEVAESVGFTKQSISDWMDKDWLCFTKEEYQEHRKKLRLKENRRLMKVADKLFAEGHSKSYVCRQVKVSHNIMRHWIQLGYVTVPPIREEMDAKIVEMALQDNKQIDIAKHFGMGQTTVSERLRKSDVYLRYKDQMFISRINLAKKLAAQGLPVPAISESLGVARSTIRRWLKRKEEA